MLIFLENSSGGPEGRPHPLRTAPTSTPHNSAFRLLIGFACPFPRDATVPRDRKFAFLANLVVSAALPRRSLPPPCSSCPSVRGHQPESTSGLRSPGPNEALKLLPAHDMRTVGEAHFQALT